MTKRFPAAAIAAITALSIFSGAASAQSLHSEAKLDTPVVIKFAITCNRGAQVVGIGADGGLYVWNLPTPTPHKMNLSDARPEAIACAGSNTLAVGLAAGKILVLDSQSGEITKRIDTINPLQDIELSPDGSLLAVASTLTPTQLWDAHTGQKLYTGVTTLGASAAAAFSPSGDVLLSADQDTHVRAYNRTGKLLYTADAGLLEPFAVSFTADGKQFAVAGADGGISLFDATSGKKLKTTLSSGNPIFGLLTSPDGKHVMVFELDDFNGKLTAVGSWDMHSEQIAKLAVPPESIIGAGTNQKHLLLIQKEGQKTITVSSLQ